MINLIVDAIWIFLPAAAANVAPVVAARFDWLPLLGRPIYERYLGSHKTWRGLVVGVIFGSVVGYVQYGFHGYGLLVGAVLGCGALVGDMAKSLIKRQLNIMPGRSWPVLDQIDYVVGATLVGGWVVPISGQQFIVAVIVLGLGSYLTSVIGVKVKIKESL